MSESVRLFRYQTLLSSRRVLSAFELMGTLEISLATLKRDIAKLREQLGVPIVFDRERGGYFLQGNCPSQLPDMGFNPQELMALAFAEQLLSHLQPGPLSQAIAPIKGRLAGLLESHGLDGRAMSGRVRIAHAGKRKLLAQPLEAATSATMRRRRLRFTHFNRHSSRHVEREVSPQRLVLFRDSWYLDALCHTRGTLRSFAVDALESPSVLDEKAVDMTPEEIDAIVYPAYGVFAGLPKAWARLRFTPELARWVAQEQWHPQQQGRLLADGSYELTLPYSDDQELVGDILRFGPEVEVLGPPSLRRRVQQLQLASVGRYVDGS